MIQVEVSQAMRTGSGRWVEVTPSRFPHERAGLEHVRALFPDHEPYRAWTNLEIITDRGRSLEVDLLVLGPGGLYLIELKGWNGRITGDRYTWQVHRRGTQTFTNPWRLANDKARVLKGMLVEAARRRGQRRGRAGARPGVPYVQAAVFLHGLDVRCELRSRERTSLYGLEGETAQTHLPGIISGLITKTPGNPDYVVTAEQAESISQLLSNLGMTRRRRRTVGPYELDESLYAEGQGWQDFLASHRRFPDERVRVRIYYTGQATTSEARAQLTRAAEREYRLLRYMNHPGLVAPRSFDETDAGPAVTYPYDPEALRLDHLLAAHPDGLPLETQLEIVRGLAEALRYAHGRHMTHRGLSPRSVLVKLTASKPAQVQMCDWQTASRIAGTSPSGPGRSDGARVSPQQRLTALLAGRRVLAPEHRPDLLGRRDPGQTAGGRGRAHVPAW